MKVQLTIHGATAEAELYDRPSRWPGLVRMGRFSYDLDALRALPDGTRIEMAAAQAAAPSTR